MARPKSIPWRKRVSIFVDYRRSGKFQPTAKDHGVARSTVTAIVNEFLDDDFSRKPRPDLPQAVLREMQEQHLAGLLGGVQGFVGEDLSTYGVGDLDLGPTTRAELETQQVEKPSLFIGEATAWHLKDTDAERALAVVQKAVQDYRRRHIEAWQDLRSELESECELTELPQLPVVGDMETEPRIFPALRDMLHNAFFELAFKRQPPPKPWLEWDVPRDAPSVLRLRRQYVAVGRAEDHENVKQGVHKFIVKNFRHFQQRFVELHQLRRDLHLMDEVTRKQRANIRAEDIRAAICPACPYPEASVGVGEPEGAKRPVAQEAK